MCSPSVLYGSAVHSQPRVHASGLEAPNVLLTVDGTVKITDFGFAKKSGFLTNDPRECHSHPVVAAEYRPPDLLVGNERYGLEVDVWSSGYTKFLFFAKVFSLIPRRCIFMELFKKKPTFLLHERELQKLKKLKEKDGPEAWKIRLWVIQGVVGSLKTEKWRDQVVGRNLLEEPWEEENPRTPIIKKSAEYDFVFVNDTNF
jgi:serine/threonine protein kinase